jgi:hypothetical protein
MPTLRASFEAVAKELSATPKTQGFLAKTYTPEKNIMVK